MNLSKCVIQPIKTSTFRSAAQGAIFKELMLTCEWPSDARVDAMVQMVTSTAPTKPKEIIFYSRHVESWYRYIMYSVQNVDLYLYTIYTLDMYSSNNQYQIITIYVYMYIYIVMSMWIYWTRVTLINLIYECHVYTMDAYPVQLGIISTVKAPISCTTWANCGKS